jgi:ectoine hydroxylase-related dioxygenase (phytanoyl-CoA dioxygenase family)
VVWAGAASDTLAKLGDDPRFLALAASVLGSDQMDQLIQQAHFKLPGDGVAFSWHQDASNRRYGSPLWRDINGQGSFVQIVVAVDPMGAHTGGLHVRPGTHRLGFDADPETGEIPPEHLDLSQAVHLELAPGDAALFGPFLIHGSGPNKGSTSRRLFLQGYACTGANGRDYPGSGLGVPRALKGKLSEQ